MTRAQIVSSIHAPRKRPHMAMRWYWPLIVLASYATGFGAGLLIGLTP